MVRPCANRPQLCWWTFETWQFKSSCAGSSSRQDTGFWLLVAPSGSCWKWGGQQAWSCPTVKIGSALHQVCAVSISFDHLQCFSDVVCRFQSMHVFGTSKVLDATQLVWIKMLLAFMGTLCISSCTQISMQFSNVQCLNATYVNVLQRMMSFCCEWLQVAPPFATSCYQWPTLALAFSHISVHIRDPVLRALRSFHAKPTAWTTGLILPNGQNRQCATSSLCSQHFIRSLEVFFRCRLQISVNACFRHQQSVGCNPAGVDQDAVSFHGDFVHFFMYTNFNAVFKCTMSQCNVCQCSSTYDVFLLWVIASRPTLRDFLLSVAHLGTCFQSHFRTHQRSSPTCTSFFSCQTHSLDNRPDLAPTVKIGSALHQVCAVSISFDHLQCLPDVVCRFQSMHVFGTSGSHKDNEFSRANHCPCITVIKHRMFHQRNVVHVVQLIWDFMYPFRVTKAALRSRFVTLTNISSPHKQLGVENPFGCSLSFEFVGFNTKTRWFF